MATTVNVKNISASTDDKEIRNFFSFWYVDFHWISILFV